ncbi:hypothetical protein BKA60DRAFT_337369 [Fusarium oxysporum]|nr:hypothetical protein BKA60DRAFT_337369 [Fusarium oxysporum]
MTFGDGGGIISSNQVNRFIRPLSKCEQGAASCSAFFRQRQRQSGRFILQIIGFCMWCGVVLLLLLFFLLLFTFIYLWLVVANTTCVAGLIF